jgi:RHS repeat-associated protein
MTSLGGRFCGWLTIAVTVLCGLATNPVLANNSPTLVPQPGVVAPGSIPELARALKYDAYLIYEYVYTNIDYSPTYGLKKGALGTILDSRGNDMDQSALLVALLRESGYTANFVYGQIQLNASELNALFGVDVSTNACPTVAFLETMGIPYNVVVSGSPVCTSPLLYADIAHMWVTATGGSLGATTYVLDPSYKTYSAVNGVNLGTATGYSASTFLTSAKAGSTQTASSIQNLNQANIASGLTGYANNLVSWIRSNMPTATTRDIIGGRYVQPLTQPYSFPTTQAKQTPGSTPTTYTTLASVQSMFGTTFKVTIGSVVKTYFADAIYGHRLSVVYNASNQPTLYLDGVAEGTAAANVTTISYEVNFPFCFATTGPASPSCGAGFTDIFTAQNAVQSTPGYTYAIVAGWDFTGRGMVDFHRRQQQALMAAGVGASTEPVLAQALNMLGYSWLAQLSAAGAINDQLIGTKVVTNCAIGVVGQVAAPYIDMPGVFVSTASLTAASNQIDTASFSYGAALSALEWGNLDQYLAPTGVGAVSTVKLFDIANTQHDILFDATATNWSTIQPQLLNYSGTDMTMIQSFITAGYRVIVPQHGNLTQGGWTGAGYMAMSKTGLVYDRLVYMISSNLKGGFSDFNLLAIDWTPPSVFIALDVQYPYMFASKDPIDLFSGAYFYDVSDLSVGSLGYPHGLTFSRSYNTGNVYTKGPLGAGWTHNLAMSASSNSDGLKGMGQDSPIDGAAVIAAAYVIQDLFSDGAKPLDKVVVATLAQKWFMDKLINNTVNVFMGSQMEQYVLLADGSYNPRIGSSNRLTLGGGAYTFKTKDGTTISFDANGNASTWQNTSGVTVSFSYDASSPPRLTAVSNNLGRSLTLAYNGSGQLESVTDNTSPSRNVAFSYDSNGNLVLATDPLGHVTSYTYVSVDGLQPPALMHQIFYPANPWAPAVTNIYDTLGRVATQMNANGAAWNYFFAGYRSEEDDPYGTQHVLYYNPRGLALFDIQDYATLGLTTRYLYDGLDRTVQVTQPEGGSTTYTYSTTNPWANNVATVTKVPKPGSSPPASLVTAYTYDTTFNKPLTVTDPLGLVTAMTYDGTTGNLLTAIANSGGLNATTTYTYNAVGLPLTVRDPTNVVTQFTYDEFGNWTATIADSLDLKQTTTYVYDSVGNVTSITDPRGNVTTATWDARRQALTSTTPATEDAPGGLTTTNTYDANGQVVQVSQSAGGAVLRTTSSTYTLTGKPETLTDARGNVTRFDYDLLDRRTSITDPMNRVTQFTYTVLGQPYRTYNTAIQAGPLLEQTWTADGLPAALKDANGNITTFTYDRFDRLVTTAYPATPAYPSGTTETATYDANGNQLTRTTRTGATIRYGYDTLDRLITKTAAASPVACNATPSGTPTITYSYDLAGRMTGVCDNSATIPSVAGPNSTVYGTTYTYNALNQPVSVIFDPVPSPTLPSTGSAVTFAYSYNAANQRSSFTSTDNAWIDYQSGPASMTNYSANALNQYACIGVFTPPCAGGVAPTYDANGNLTSDGTYTFGYDVENRLTSASTAGVAAAYTFDGRGRRKTKTVNGTTTVFVTDADNREVVEYGGTGTLLRWYAYGLGPNDVLSQLSAGAGTRLTPIPDLLGSLIAHMDTSVGTVARFGYKPYGGSSSPPVQFAYTGQRIDTELGDYYYYRARHYSPGLGRFLQSDPLGYASGVNLYSYVGNDPVNQIDPSGELPPLLVPILAAALSGGSAGIVTAYRGGSPWEIGLASAAGAGAGGALATVGAAGLIARGALSVMPRLGSAGSNVLGQAVASGIGADAGVGTQYGIRTLTGGTFDYSTFAVDMGAAFALAAPINVQGLIFSGFKTVVPELPAVLPPTVQLVNKSLETLGKLSVVGISEMKTNPSPGATAPVQAPKP